MASTMDRELVRDINLWIFVTFVLLCPSYVQCQTEGQLRLVDGSQDGSGRVEIYHNYQWGTICDDTFDSADAEVVCRQLGFGTLGVRAYTSYIAGTGPIHLDGTYCTGAETRLEYCSLAFWGVNNCDHSEDAAVECDATEGDVRLVGGSSSDEGRVEIYHNGEWGTVCDDNWDDSDARVVCRQLGYSNDVGVAMTGGTYGWGSGPIHLDDVICSGYESRLTYCSDNGWGVNDCGHSEDAGVQCNYSPRTSSRVVGIMSFVGVSLSLLTLVALIAVCYTCNRTKPAIQPRSSGQVPLSTVTSHPAAHNTPAAPTTNGMTYPADVPN